jgi:hypothetical protein
MRVRTGQIVEERATQTDALVGSLISGLADIPVPLFVNDWFTVDCEAKEIQNYYDQDFRTFFIFHFSFFIFPLTIPMRRYIINLYQLHSLTWTRLKEEGITGWSLPLYVVISVFPPE